MSFRDITWYIDSESRSGAFTALLYKSLGLGYVRLCKVQSACPGEHKLQNLAWKRHGWPSLLSKAILSSFRGRVGLPKDQWCREGPVIKSGSLFYDLK